MTIDAPISQGNSPFWPIALRHGLIAGLILIAVGLIMQMTGLVDPTNQQQGFSTGNVISTLLNIAVMAGAAYMAVAMFRDSALGGWVTFGQAFKMSMGVFLIIAVLTAVWTFIYISFVSPDLLETAREQAFEQAAQRSGGELPEEAAKMMNIFISPWFFAVSSLFATLLLGLLIALVTALVMKKEPNTSVM